MSTIKPQEFRASPWRMGVLIVPFGVVGAAGALAGVAGYPGGWMAAALFLPLAGLLMWRLFSGKPDFSVSSSAVTLRDGTSVPWGDVTRLEQTEYKGRRAHPMYVLELHRTDGSVTRFGLNHLRQSVDEVVALVEAASGRPVERPG